MDFQILLIPVVIFIIYSWSKTMPNRVEPLPVHNQKKSKKRRRQRQNYIIEDNGFDTAFACAGVGNIGIEDDNLFASDNDLFSENDFSCSATNNDFMSDTDTFDWNDSIGSNEWFNDPAYSELEGNLYHHSDDSF